MIKLEMTVDDDNISIDDLKRALSMNDAYVALHQIRCMLKSAVKHGELTGHREPLTAEENNILSIFQDRFFEICSDLPPEWK